MLFEAYQLGGINLSKRIVMGPMTRCRAAQPGNVPTALMAEHYAQRASAGLIVSEGAPVSPQGHGYLWTPGIYTPQQVQGWKLVTEAVHGKGGHIFAQIWHVGRVSHISLQENGQAPVSAGGAAAQANCFAYDENGNPGNVPCSPPQPLTADGIRAVVEDFRRATANALAAGFDGVEIHGANGYLFDQFLNSQLNTRSDAYGGSLANRARLLLDAVDAAIAEAGAQRVGVRLSPHGGFNDMPEDPDTEAMVCYLAEELERRGVVYIHFMDQVSFGFKPIGEGLLREVKKRYRGTVIVCGGMSKEQGERYLAEGLADLIGFGQLFISNPDLPERLRRNAELAQPDQATFYGGGAAGYTDYPFLAD
ncbi:MAG: alkene reductase [Sulfuricellaceae bacterium]|nr:alkene reductase [Sulfuricellaceae bacterium]